MKEFKVIPFTPTHNKKGLTSLDEVAEQLEELLTDANHGEWQYERIETITSHVPAKGGCFGFFRDPAFDMSNHFVVFSRDSE